jgi:hypothetical protein
MGFGATLGLAFEITADPEHAVAALHDYLAADGTDRQLSNVHGELCPHPGWSAERASGKRPA